MTAGVPAADSLGFGVAIPFYPGSLVDLFPSELFFPILWDAGAALRTAAFGFEPLTPPLTLTFAEEAPAPV